MSTVNIFAKKRLFVLIGLQLLVFIYSVEIRRPFFGQLSEGNHQWLTGEIIKFSKNWYREGPLNLGFLNLEAPLSIETPEIEQRSIYSSYPSGTTLQVYLVAKLLQREPDVSIVMGLNLLQHFLIALVLSFIVLVFIEACGIGGIELWSLPLLTSALYLLLPGPLYWHQNVYFADQAVILPFALVCLAECLITRSQNRKSYVSQYLEFGVFLCCLWGMSLDWLFAFVYFSIILKRYLLDEMGGSIAQNLSSMIKIAFPFALSLSFFCFQIFYFGQWQNLYSKFLFRTATSDSGKSFSPSLQYFYDIVFKGHANIQLGQMAEVFCQVSVLSTLIVLMLLILKKFRINAPRTESLAFKIGTTILFMTVLPCYGQLTLLRNHSVIHHFSALKLAIIVSVLPFCVLPRLALELIPWKKFHSGRNGLALVSVIFLAVGLSYLAKSHGNYRILFPEPNPEYQKLGAFITKNSDFQDVLISDVIQVEVLPPQMISMTMKQVYKVQDKSELLTFVQKSPKEANICFVTYTGRTMMGLATESNGVKEISDGRYVLLRFKRDQILTLLGLSS